MTTTNVVFEVLGDHNQTPGARSWGTFDSEEEIRANSEGKKIIARGLSHEEAQNLCAENCGTTMARKLLLASLSGQELDSLMLIKAGYALNEYQKSQQFKEELWRIGTLILSLLQSAPNQE